MPACVATSAARTCADADADAREKSRLRLRSSPRRSAPPSSGAISGDKSRDRDENGSARDETHAHKRHRIINFCVLITTRPLPPSNLETRQRTSARSHKSLRNQPYTKRGVATHPRSPYDGLISNRGQKSRKRAYPVDSLDADADHLTLRRKRGKLYRGSTYVSGSHAIQFNRQVDHSKTSRTVHLQQPRYASHPDSESDSGSESSALTELSSLSSSSSSSSLTELSSESESESELAAVSKTFIPTATIHPGSKPMSFILRPKPCLPMTQDPAKKVGQETNASTLELPNDEHCQEQQEKENEERPLPRVRLIVRPPCPPLVYSMSASESVTSFTTETDGLRTPENRHALLDPSEKKNLMACIYGSRPPSSQLTPEKNLSLFPTPSPSPIFPWDTTTHHTHKFREMRHLPLITTHFTESPRSDDESLLLFSGPVAAESTTPLVLLDDVDINADLDALDLLYLEDGKDKAEMDFSPSSGSAEEDDERENREQDGGGDEDSLSRTSSSSSSSSSSSPSPSSSSSPDFVDSREYALDVPGCNAHVPPKSPVEWMIKDGSMVMTDREVRVALGLLG